MHQEAGFRPELVARSVFLAPGAVVLGDVTIGAESSVWYNAVVRGDVEAIRIGQQTNIQDLCVLHADFARICRTAMHYVQAARQLCKQRGT